MDDVRANRNGAGVVACARCSQERTATSAGADELLNEEPRKTGWMRAEAAAIQARVASRSFGAETAGSRRACAIWCAIMWSSVSVMKTRCWSSGQDVVRSGATIHRLGRKDHELSGGGVRGLCVVSRGHTFMDRALCPPKS